MKCILPFLLLLPFIVKAQTFTSSQSSQQKVIYEDEDIKRTVTIGPTSITITNWINGEELQVAIVGDTAMEYGDQICNWYQCIGPNDIKYIVIPCLACDTPHISVTERRLLTALQTVIEVE